MRVEIPAAVKTEGEAFALSDIAAIQGAEELKRRAGALLLSADQGFITREQVVEALKVSGLEGVRVELKMPSRVSVEVSSETSLVEDGAATVPDGGRGEGTEDLKEIVRALAAWDGDVELAYRGGVPPGRLTFPASLVPGTPAATLRFRDAAGTERSLAVRMTWTQPVLVLVRSVKRGEPIRDADLTVRQIRIARPGVYASRREEVVGRTLRKDLSQGEPVSLNLLLDMPIIERGKAVTILVSSGGITVKTKGEALESGSMGQAVKVRNLSSKIVVTAVVVAKDTVEVKMP